MIERESCPLQSICKFAAALRGENSKALQLLLKNVLDDVKHAKKQGAVQEKKEVKKVKEAAHEKKTRGRTPRMQVSAGDLLSVKYALVILKKRADRGALSEMLQAKYDALLDMLKGERDRLPRVAKLDEGQREDIVELYDEARTESGA
jgi:hypothetical protein